MKMLNSLLLATTVLFTTGHAAAADLGPQSSTAAGVTVKVTPKDVSPQAEVWQFAVAFDTHSQDLRDDLAKTATLVDARGGRHAPLAWEGAPPGGHHRAGVLRFKGLHAQGEALELQILRPGEHAPRVFRWKLN
jgi:hypothetical protein